MRNQWFHTGDIGRFDEDGFFYFVDRKKDYLKRRGGNISSYEMEVAIRAHRPSSRWRARSTVEAGRRRRQGDCRAERLARRSHRPTSACGSRARAVLRRCRATSNSARNCRRIPRTRFSEVPAAPGRRDGCHRDLETSGIELKTLNRAAALRETNMPLYRSSASTIRPTRWNCATSCAPTTALTCRATTAAPCSPVRCATAATTSAGRSRSSKPTARNRSGVSQGTLLYEQRLQGVPRGRIAHGLNARTDGRPGPELRNRLKR
jgi:hypothetical protein